MVEHDGFIELRKDPNYNYDITHCPFCGVVIGTG